MTKKQANAKTRMNFGPLPNLFIDEDSEIMLEAQRQFPQLMARQNSLPEKIIMESTPTFSTSQAKHDLFAQ